MRHVRDLCLCCVMRDTASLCRNIRSNACTEICLGETEESWSDCRLTWWNRNESTRWNCSSVNAIGRVCMAVNKSRWETNTVCDIQLEGGLTSFFACDFGAVMRKFEMPFHSPASFFGESGSNWRQNVDDHRSMPTGSATSSNVTNLAGWRSRHDFAGEIWMWVGWVQ